MPAEESTPAIVLRARDYSESDRIVSLLTLNFGKLCGIAKGAKASRRRFQRKLEPFSQVTLFFRRRPHGQLVFITRAEPADTTPVTLADDLAKIALGSYMLELADGITTEEAEAREAYRVLAGALDALGRGQATTALRQAYELKMLAACGFGLEFGRCRSCGAEPDPASAVYFVAARGGIVCGRCRPSTPEEAIRLKAPLAGAAQALSQAPLDLASTLPDGGAEASLAIRRFLGSVLGRKLRSTEFLDSML